jgi:cyclopropane fatty-acyl-phospholipid synthase-like methyltransferase
MDAAPQTFFYTLTNLMKLQESKNILEVGCGAGKLLSTVLDLKPS